MDMSSIDIWQKIVKELPTYAVVKFRVLSSKHKVICDLYLDSKAVVMDEKLLIELTSWAYNAVKMKRMDFNSNFYTGMIDNQIQGSSMLQSTPDMFNVEGLYSEQHSSSANDVPTQQPFIYEFEILDEDVHGVHNERMEEIFFEKHTEKCSKCNEGENCGWKYIPTLSEINFDTIIKLPWDLELYNKAGPNHDYRGVKSRLEFVDFTSIWYFTTPYITIRQFVEGCYRLKSHKWENWYEMIHGTDEISKPQRQYNRDRTKVRVTLSVDHGS